jgi:hypothetical protein
MTVHKQIAHITDPNEGIINCPEYVNCQFAISMALLKNGNYILLERSNSIF